MKQVAHICKKWRFLTLLGLTNILIVSVIPMRGQDLWVYSACGLV